MHFLFVEKDFVIIIMYSKRRFGYASVYRWIVNALRPAKSSLGMPRSISLSVASRARSRACNKIFGPGT